SRCEGAVPRRARAVALAGSAGGTGMGATATPAESVEVEEETVAAATPEPAATEEVAATGEGAHEEVAGLLAGAQAERTATSDVVVELRALRMEFGGVVAINRVSLEVGRNQIFGVIGPNGAGKTTVF